MYNSYTVRGLSRLWGIINEFYKFSILKILVDTIVRALKSISSGSYVVGFFTSDVSLIEKSGIYSVYQKLVCFIESVFTKLRGLAAKYREGSLVNNICISMFHSASSTIGTISLFVIAFSVINIAIDALNGNIITYGNIALIIMTIISIIANKYRDNLKDVVLNSFIIRFIKDIFTIDDGGDQWW